MILSNTQYSEIMRIYSARQRKVMHDLDKRMKEVYTREPKFEEIDDAIADASIGFTKNKLSGNPLKLPPLSETIALYKNKKIELLRNMGYPDDYLAPRYFCPECQDTGYVAGLRCRCFHKLATDMVYSKSNLKNMTETENFSTFSFDYYDDSYIDPTTGKSPLGSAKEAYDKARFFIDTFDESFNNIFLYGDTGVGKTFLTNCIASELIDRGKSVIYYTAIELFDALARNTFKKDSGYNIYDYILDCDALIIDDIGTEIPNAFTCSQLFLIVNERILRQKSTIISTNLAVNDFSNIYTERTFSRISSSYTVLKLTGQDIRIKKRAV